MTKEITKADGPNALYWEKEFKQQCINILSSFKKLSENLLHTPNEQLGEVFDFTYKFESKLEDINKHFKGRIRDYVNANGKQATEAGTKRLMVGNYELEIQPQGKQKLEDDKIEQLLRMNGLNPEEYMTVTKKYTVNEAKLQMLVTEGKLTKEEIAMCMGKAKDFKVMAPKPMKDVDSIKQPQLKEENNNNE